MSHNETISHLRFTDATTCRGASPEGELPGRLQPERSFGAHPLPAAGAGAGSGVDSGFQVLEAVRRVAPQVETIVRDHGGRLECRSRLGEGALFQLWLPVPG